MADRLSKDDAQKQFAKLQRAEDGKKAMTEYEAEGAAMRAKTARLRALRLARDADIAAGAPSPQAGARCAARATPTSPQPRSRHSAPKRRRPRRAQRPPSRTRESCP